MKRGQGLVEYAISLAIVAIIVIVAVIAIAALIAPGTKHAPNEFCRSDTIGKVTYETCITPAAPMPTKGSAQ